MRVSLFALALLAPLGCPAPGESTPPPVPVAAAPASFDELLAAVDAAAPGERQGLADAFLAERALPIVEDGAAVFVLRGRGAALLAGDFDGWSGGPLSLLADTDVAFARRPLPNDARVDYKFIVDGEYILDPANSSTCPSGFGDNSELAMPGWVYPVDIDFDPAIAHGTLNDVVISGDDVPAPLAFESRGLGNVRDLWIYLPAGVSDGVADVELPLLVVNDGGEYLRLAHMHHVLDAAIARREIEPIAVAFVAPVDRQAEYVGENVEGYVAMIRDELIPLVQERVSLTATPGAHGVWGTSFSGYVAVRLAADLAPTFGRVASQSGRVLIDGGRAVEGLGALEGRLWLDTGLLFDTAEENRDALDRLGDSALAVSFVEVNEGHSWGSWRARIGPGLRHLFAPAAP